MRAATAGTVAPSHLLLTFGKLTIKFEMLCKETKNQRFQSFGGETREFFARRAARARGAERGAQRSRAETDEHRARRSCGAACAKRQNKAAKGSLVRYLYLIV